MGKNYSLEFFDVRTKSYLAFSGDWVDVKGPGNAKFPPFIRNPYGTWLSGTNFNVDNCLDDNYEEESEECQLLRDDYFTFIRGLDTLNTLEVDMGVQQPFEFQFISQSGEVIPTDVMKNDWSIYTILYDAELTYESKPFLVYARLEGNETWVSCGAVIKSSMKNYMYVSEEVELSCDAYDRDDDGYTDSEEVAASSDPNNPASTPDDLDGDGFSNSVEENAGSDPNSAASTPDDLDGDGFSNSVEESAGSDPNNAASTPDDLDGDGVPNVEEPDPEDPSIPLAIEAPTDLQVVANNQTISLSWTAVGNAVTYNVYYSTESFAGITEASNLAINGAEIVSDITDSTYLISGLENDITYYIVVTALSAYGEESAPSNGVSGIPKQQVVAAGTGKLNDTGITLCGNYGYIGQLKSTLNCADTGATQTSSGTDQYGNNVPAGQDAHFGRDALAASGQLTKIGGGSAGFDFTKLDANGNDLAESATEWSCVRDNVTGLIWEVKDPSNGIVGDGLHDADDRYNWYSTDSSTNGGHEGSAADGAICFGYENADSTTYCNTEAFVNRVNTAGLCGANDWRMPKKEELLSIVHYGSTPRNIDTDYFPNTVNDSYWSGSPCAVFSMGLSWVVIFGIGETHTPCEGRGSASDNPVRLVRSAQ
jgi:hypothetical protein